MESNYYILMSTINIKNLKSVKKAIATQLKTVDIKFDSVDDLATLVNANKVNEMTYSEFTNLVIDSAVELSVFNPKYDKMAVQLTFNLINKLNLERELSTFSEKMNFINDNTDSFMAEKYIEFVNEHSEFLNNICNTNNKVPNFLTYFGYVTLNGSYCIKLDEVNVETPIDMILRCATGINYKLDIPIEEKLASITTTFNYMYAGKFTHATPSLFNAGTCIDQFSSCFILGMEDSIEGIYDTLKDCARISKSSGGIGFSMSNVRATNSKIRSSNGESSGLIPMCKVYNYTARYVNQGGRGKKRPGAFAAFTEIWHADIVDVIKSRLQVGDEETLLRDLFIGLWIPNLFMKKLEKDEDWYLMCPNECPGLDNVYGQEFETLYQQYVDEKKYRAIIKPSEIMVHIIKTMSSSGNPYIMFKDNVNEKCNQSNIGTVKSSNLCCEITEVANANQHAVCNLASIAVNKFIMHDENGEMLRDTSNNIMYDYEDLKNLAYHITRNLNKVIDINKYPTAQAENTNNATRPIGVGIQGVADLLAEMRIPYESLEATSIEAKIMETIYYGCISASTDLALLQGKPYDYFENSCFSRGIFQFDMGYGDVDLMWDWKPLKEKARKSGLSNSLLTALMPTASTSQILGNNECFEPFTTNLYIRKTSHGTFTTVNKYLVADLQNLGLWTHEMSDIIIQNQGSIASIESIPADIKALYKTVWEMKQRWIVDHAVARAPFVDQSQSMNLYFPTIELGKTQSAMVYAWKKGLKTGSYYVHSQPAHITTNIAKSDATCSRTNAEVCESCSA